MRKLIIFLFLPFNFLLAQQDTMYIKGSKADTIIIKNSPVQVSKQLVIQEYNYKEVNRFFFIRPYISSMYFYCDCKHSYSSVTSQAFCYSVREKGGENVGLDVGYKFSNYNILIGYSYFLFNDKVNDYKNAIYDNNRYTQSQLTVKFMYELIVKKIKIVPYVGLSYSIAGISTTTYPILDSNKIAFKPANDLQRAGNLLVNSGLDFRFFNTKRISPFIGLGFTRSLTYEGNEKKYDVQFIRYIYTASVGMLVKF